MLGLIASNSVKKTNENKRAKGPIELFFLFFLMKTADEFQNY